MIFKIKNNKILNYKALFFLILSILVFYIIYEKFDKVINQNFTRQNVRNTNQGKT